MSALASADPPVVDDLSAYLARPVTPPDPAVVEAIARGPVDPRDALTHRSLDRLLDPAPLPVETGWCTLADGVAYAAVRTEMPGVSGEMIDWWFDWHARDPIRYQIWSPSAHASNRYEPPASAGAKRHWGAVHHPVEDIGRGMESLRIAFHPPTRVGFSTDGVDDPRVTTIVAGLAGDDRRRVQHTLMAHVYLACADGLVVRSHFWIGAVLRPYAPAVIASPVAGLLNRRSVRTRAVPQSTARAVAQHCADEYANLVALLPELHARYGRPLA